MIAYKNYLKETDTESNNGVFVPKDNTKSKVKGYLRINWDGDEMLENYDSLEQYTRPGMPIPAQSIWKKIVKFYDAIPIEKVSQTSSIEQLLEEIQVLAEENAKEYGKGFMNTSTHCYIETENFREIVEKNGWYFNQARIEIDKLGLFDKDRTGGGYQKAKKIDGQVKRYYVLKKVFPTEINPPEQLEDVKFDCNYKTQTEKRIARLEKENKEYLDRYNDLALKTGEEYIL